MPLYIAYNGPSPTTAAQLKVTTGTAIKTLLQIATPSTREIEVVEWGFSVDGITAATPGIVELLQTDVAATVTSLTPTVYRPSNAPASLCVGGGSLDGLYIYSRGNNHGDKGVRRTVNCANQPIR